MSKTRLVSDKHVAKCVALQMSWGGSLSVPEMMELSGFPPGYRNSHAKHAWIYQCIKASPPVPVDIEVYDGTMSSVTVTSATINLPPVHVSIILVGMHDSISS